MYNELTKEKFVSQQYASPILPPNVPKPIVQPPSYDSYVPGFVPMPPVPQIYDSDTNEECDIFDKSMLQFDSAMEHMLLFSVISKNTTQNSGTKNSKYGVVLGTNRKHKSTAHEQILSNGCVRLIQVFCLVDEKGCESPAQCEVEIIYRNPIKRIFLPVNAICNKEKNVQNLLSDNGVTFIKNGFKIWCEKFVDCISKVQTQPKYLDFYKDENGNWYHGKVNEIALQATDSLGILDRLGIDFSEIADRAFLHLTFLLYGICGKIFAVIRDLGAIPMAKLAIVYPERSAAMDDLKSLYCSDSNIPIYTDKLFENQILCRRNEVALISLFDSDYMKKKCLEILSRHETELMVLPLLFSKSEEDFSCLNDVLQLSYDITGIGNIDDVLCWAVKAMLNESKLSSDLKRAFDRYSIMLEQDTETMAIRNLISILMALSEVYLPRLGVAKNELVAILQRYNKYLLDSTDSSSQITIERLKEFLISRRDIGICRFNTSETPNKKDILIKDDLMLFSRPVFEHTAKYCSTTRTSLANVLLNYKALQGNQGSFMRNIRFGKTTERMYVLDCSKLFDIGELRPMCPDEYLPAPLYKIPIGTSDNYEIFFDIYPIDCIKNNPFALITGTTGSGKSTLCKTLAISAANLGLSVVILGTDTSLLDLECDTYEPGDIAEISIKSFFEILSTELTEVEASLSDTALTLMLDQYYESYDEILDCFCELVIGEDGMDSLLIKAQKAVDQLTGFSWEKAVVDGKISQVIAQTPKETEQLLLDFFNYKSGQDDTQYTLLLLDEVQDFSWDSKSTLVSKILRKGRKYGIVGVFSSQFLNADNGTNIAAALRQIETYFVFKPSNEIGALKYLGYTSKDTEARQVLEMLDTGEVVAKGHISTDICALNYPVRFNVNTEF